MVENANQILPVLPQSPSFFFNVSCLLSQAMTFIRHSLMYVFPSVPHTGFTVVGQSSFFGQTHVGVPSGGELWQIAYFWHLIRLHPPTDKKRSWHCCKGSIPPQEQQFLTFYWILFLTKAFKTAFFANFKNSFYWVRHSDVIHSHFYAQLLRRNRITPKSLPHLKPHFPRADYTNQ